jgi:hypothetical protein
VFSDASAGAAQLFTYEFEQHAADIRKHVHLFTGESAETEVAVYCPTTLYRLGGDLHRTIESSYLLRDVCNFDVLDELLIADGALTTERYKALVVFQADIVDQPILDKIAAFRQGGGKVILIGKITISNVAGKLWPEAPNLTRVSRLASRPVWLSNLSRELAEFKGFDGQLDGVWISRRGAQVFAFNSNHTLAAPTIDGAQVSVAPRSIYVNKE